LFAGVGGFDMGFEQAGWDCKFQVEWDKNCQQILNKHWPNDHTRYKADGTEQADTHRYKQCGNGVASPVARWVAEQIAKVEYAEG
jgi:site-specific DNA-cytosine methylase